MFITKDKAIKLLHHAMCHIIFGEGPEDNIPDEADIQAAELLRKLQNELKSE